MKAKNIAIVIIILIILGVATVFVYTDYLGAGNGTLSIGITDRPVSAVSHIYLTISDVELQGSGNSTTTFQTGKIQFDLLSLVNVTNFIGNVSIPSGNYTMIRFSITSAVATISGSNVTLNVPSGQVKVPVQFQVKSGKTTMIVLDVTADMTNISASGNLRPVVTVKSMTGPS